MNSQNNVVTVEFATGCDVEGHDDRKEASATSVYARLSKALEEMSANLLQQAELVKTYRGSLSRLDDEFAAMDVNMNRYQGNLERINVRPLRRRAVALGRIADSWAGPGGCR